MEDPQKTNGIFLMFLGSKSDFWWSRMEIMRLFKLILEALNGYGGLFCSEFLNKIRGKATEVQWTFKIFTL